MTIAGLEFFSAMWEQVPNRNRRQNTDRDFSALHSMPLPKPLRANSFVRSSLLTGGLRHQARRFPSWAVRDSRDWPSMQGERARKSSRKWA